MEEKKIYSAIILAAGNGTRFKGKKQDIIFEGKQLWKNVLDKISTIVERKNIIVVGKDIPGGDTRTQSVFAGLQALPKNTTRVIILEAARPLVTIKQIEILLNEKHVSCSFVKPLVNTVIYKNGEYINRNDVYDLLTPQAFDYQMLFEAYNSGKFTDITDDTRIMYEYFGIKPHFIVTEMQNLYKVTYPSDIEILHCIKEKMEE